MHISTDIIDSSLGALHRIVVDDPDLVAPLSVLLCSVCCSKFDLCEAKPVSADTFFEPTRFPYVAPVCLQCAGDFGFLPVDDKNAV